MAVTDYVDSLMMNYVFLSWGKQQDGKAGLQKYRSSKSILVTKRKHAGIRFMNHTPN